MSSGRTRILAAAAVLLNLVVLFAPQAPEVPGDGRLPIDKLVHLLVFAWPTVALIGAGLPRRWVLLGMVAWAPFSELVQRLLLHHRSGDPLDMLVDLLGVAVGAWLTRPRPGRAARGVAGADAAG